MPAYSSLTSGYQKGCRAAALVFVASLLMLGGSVSVHAQEPTPAAMATAKELIQAKGATSMFDPVVPGVIESAKNSLLRTSPQLGRELNEVAAQLRTEYAAKRGEVADEMARIYARHFTEAELKEALAFYKTALGKKLIVEEPRVLDESMSRVQAWAERFSDEALARIRAEMKKRGHTL
jgi:hypothetical protein